MGCVHEVYSPFDRHSQYRFSADYFMRRSSKRRLGRCFLGQAGFGFIGAGLLITKNVAPKSVFITPDTPRFRLDSSAFLKLTKMK